MGRHILYKHACEQRANHAYIADACVCRMDLGAARSGDAAAVARERSRFMRAIEPMLQHEGPKLLVTDSQV